MNSHPQSSFQVQLVRNFSRSAMRYDNYASIQSTNALRLADDIHRSLAGVVTGPVLELGCGTGILSTHLISQFAHQSSPRSRQVILSDLSNDMLSVCRNRFSPQPNVELKTIDANTFHEADTYAVIVSAFTLQWLSDLPSSMERITASLKPGGKFFFSFPSAKSFPEWRLLCTQAGVPFTANRLPDVEIIRDINKDLRCDLMLYEESFTASYPSLKLFFKGLKALGASTQMQGVKLTYKEMQRLLSQAARTYPRSFPMTYHVVRGCLTRPGGGN